MRLRTLAVCPLIATLACSSSSPNPASDAGMTHVGEKDARISDSSDAKVADAPTVKHEPDASAVDAAPVQRGPMAIPIPNADPNGIFWDSTTSTLYVADNENDAVLTWTDTGGFKPYVTLPGPTGNEVGGIVRLSDGTLVVPEFGFGTAGLVAIVHPDGSTATVPGLDPTKRRLGIAVAADGTIYESYFDKVNGAQTGFIATLDITAGTETDVITGLEKPVGVAVVGTTLFVSDQNEDEILSASTGSPQTYKALSTNLTPDLLSVGAAGAIFSGSPTGVVYQINTATGTFNTLFTASGTLEPRGTAYDAVNKRLFVAEHDSADIANYIEIVPVGE